MKDLLKYGVLAIFILGLFVNLYAQNDSELLIPYRKGKKWGYMNTHEELVIKTKYQEVYPFENNRGRVKKNGKYGFIDKSGEVKIEFQYEHVSDFTYGRANLGGTLLYLNTSGDTIHIPAGCGGVFGGRLDYHVFEEKGLKGIVQSYPYDTLVEAKYKDAKVFGMVKVFPVMDDNDKWGVISKNDSLLQPFIYDAIVVIDQRNNEYFTTYIDRRIGAINRQGELEAEAKYYTLKKYKYCYFVILENGQKGFVYKGKEYWKH